LDLLRRTTDTSIIHSTSGTHTMNTMTNTAEFSNEIAQADHSAFIPTLLSKMLGLLRLTGGMNSIDSALLADRIVHD
jgi:hypothetical protein